MSYRSWGCVPDVVQRSYRFHGSEGKLPESDSSFLAYGNGRSYGDSCLNSEGFLIDTRSLDSFVEFDRATGLIRCEAGVLLKDLLSVCVPAGWFVPVSPGTSYITLGGALCNDIHGKNHHRDGCFGRYVKRFELLRSDGQRILCSSESNSGFYRATIGGLGLTGLVTWLELQLMPIQTQMMEIGTSVFRGMNQFEELSNRYADSHQYSVAWIDCLATGRNFARGIHIRANHLLSNLGNTGAYHQKYTARLPFNCHAKLLSSFSVKAFNSGYYYYNSRIHPKSSAQSLTKFFYPLDSVRDWNKIYGKSGFFQYQCVIPYANREALRTILKTIAESGQASFLAVLKDFGIMDSPGIMSFPRHGRTLALDFPDKGLTTRELLRRLDDIVRDAGGAIYPAKDKRMSTDLFKAFFPRLDEFSEFVDPKFSSDFWRRVSG